jgi:hypothetical protein
VFVYATKFSQSFEKSRCLIDSPNPFPMNSVKLIVQIWSTVQLSSSAYVKKIETFVSPIRAKYPKDAVLRAVTSPRISSSHF